MTFLKSDGFQETHMNALNQFSSKLMTLTPRGGLWTFLANLALCAARCGGDATVSPSAMIEKLFSLLYSFVDRMKLGRQAGNLRNTAMTGISVSFVKKPRFWWKLRIWERVLKACLHRKDIVWSDLHCSLQIFETTWLIIKLTTWAAPSNDYCMLSMFISIFFYFLFANAFI